jgi:hypothetical protein
MPEVLRLRSEFRLQASAALTPAKRLKFKSCRPDQSKDAFGFRYRTISQFRTLLTKQFEASAEINCIGYTKPEL